MNSKKVRKVQVGTYEHTENEKIFTKMYYSNLFTLKETCIKFKKKINLKNA